MDGAVDYYFAYPHCGVESLRVVARWWIEVEPLYGDDGPRSSADGWGDPYQEGELTLDCVASIPFEAEDTGSNLFPPRRPSR